MKLTYCGITIDINPIEASRYMAAGYVPVVEDEEPASIPAPAQPELEAEMPKARKSAKRKG